MHVAGGRRLRRFAHPARALLGCTPLARAPLLCALLVSAQLLTPAAAAECVVLLHGLARSASSMEPMAEALRDAGYTVANIDYPSRTAPIETLAPAAIGAGRDACGAARPLHFVTHSLGGILVRWFLANNTLDDLGRVVMLAPPNQGSEVVDDWGEVPGFEWLNGPAGQQLGTGDNSVPRALGAVDFPLGVIAGTSSINLILSRSLPDPDDGKVSVASTRVEGMADFLTVAASHPFIMGNATVIEQTLHFLRHEQFRRAAD